MATDEEVAVEVATLTVPPALVVPAAEVVPPAEELAAERLDRAVEPDEAPTRPVLALLEDRPLDAVLDELREPADEPDAVAPVLRLELLAPLTEPVELTEVAFDPTVGDTVVDDDTPPLEAFDEPVALLAVDKPEELDRAVLLDREFELVTTAVLPEEHPQLSYADPSALQACTP